MPFMKNQIPSSPTMKQGIVAVLGSDTVSKKPAAGSIRRTLSADMSSKNWAHQNGFPSPFKYSPSSSSPTSPSSSSSSSSSQEFHQTPGDRDDVWRSIQNNNQVTAKTESWDSILSRKKETPLLPPPYERRSLSGLSDESLEICTERLGSESGSDCFPSSDYSTECLTVVKEQGRVDRRKASPPVRSFPPPMPSIAGGGDGGGWASQFQMQSRRENGRLIVEAVSVSPGNYFEARRGGGRLVLTLFRGRGKMESEEVDQEVFEDMEGVPAEEVVDDGGGDEEKEEDEEELGAETKRSSSPPPPSGKMSVSKKGLVMKKFVAMGNTNAAWSSNDKEEIPILQSLPPQPMVPRLIAPPPATGASSFNAYEYFWRTKTTVSCSFVNPVITTRNSIRNKNSDHHDDNNNNKNNNVVYENQNMVMVKGNKGDDLVPYTKGCKVARRSLMFWEPYCIATS